MVSDDDWRLQGQEKYLTGATLYRRRWTQTRPHWDHDHCAFCWAEFGAEDSPDVLHYGYTDIKEYRWICEKCFQDFREQFSWKLPTESN